MTHFAAVYAVVFSLLVLLCGAALNARALRKLQASRGLPTLRKRVVHVVGHGLLSLLGACACVAATWMLTPGHSLESYALSSALVLFFGVTLDRELLGNTHPTVAR